MLLFATGPLIQELVHHRFLGHRPLKHHHPPIPRLIPIDLLHLLGRNQYRLYLRPPIPSPVQRPTRLPWLFIDQMGRKNHWKPPILVMILTTQGLAPWISQTYMSPHLDLKAKAMMNSQSSNRTNRAKGMRNLRKLGSQPSHLKATRLHIPSTDKTHAPLHPRLAHWPSLQRLRSPVRERVSIYPNHQVTC